MDSRDETRRRAIRRTIAKLAIGAVVVLVLLVLLGRFTRGNLDERLEAVEVALQAGEENRSVTCSMADLIAHVPAVQFEGEPLGNFIGWIDARRDILIDIRSQESCDREVVRALERRIEIDARLLEQIRNEAP